MARNPQLCVRRRSSMLRRAAAGVALGLPLAMCADGAWGQQLIVNGTFDNNANFTVSNTMTASAAMAGRWQHSAAGWSWQSSGGNPGGRVQANGVWDNSLSQVVAMPTSGTMQLQFQYLSAGQFWMDVYWMTEGQSFDTTGWSAPPVPHGVGPFQEVEFGSSGGNWATYNSPTFGPNLGYQYVVVSFWPSNAALSLDNISLMLTGAGGGGGGGGGGTAPPPTGVTRTWDAGGAGDTNWGNVLNWDGDASIPAPGDNVVFGTGGSTATLNVAGAVNNITFQRGADFTVDASGGNVLMVGGTIAGNDAFSYVVNAPVTLGNPTITVNTQGVQPMPVSGIPQTNVWLAGVIDGSGGITKTGPGRLRISNTGNTFSGEVNINQGDLVITTSGSGQLGNASAVNLGATSGSASATLWFGNNATNITRPVVVRSGSTGTLTIRMPSSSGTARAIGALVTVNRDVTIDVNGTAGGSLNQNEGILALNNGLNVVAGTVTKTGFGQLNIAGPFTLNGSLINNGQGTININTGINLGNATRNIGSTNYPGAQPVININSGPISATDPAAGLNITGQSDLLIITNQNHTFTGTLDIQTGNIWRATGGSLAAPVNLSHPDSTLATRTTYTIKGLSGSGQVYRDQDNTTGTLQINVDANNTFSFAGRIRNLTGSFQDGFITSTMVVTKQGPGTQVFTGNNTYTGNTTIQGGVLRANDGQGLPSASPLVLAGGVLEGIGTTSFTRALGTGAGQVNWTAAGGFSATGGKMTVNLGGAGAGVTWSTGGFVSGSNALILSGATATNVTEFVNPIDVGDAGGTARTILVNDNPGSTIDKAVLTGNLTGGGATGRPLIKAGNGTLEINGPNNTIMGDLTIQGGTVQLGGNAPNLLNVSGAGNLTLTGTAAVTANHVRVNTLALQGSSTLTIRANGGNAGVSKVTSISFAPPPPPPAPPMNILFMVNNPASLNQTDAAVLAFLQNPTFFPNGNTVTVVSETTNVMNGSPPIIAGKDIAIISESVGSGNAANAFLGAAGNMRTMTTPLINWEPALFDEIGFSSAGGSAGNFTQLAVPASPNPLIPPALYAGLTVGGNTTIFGPGTGGEGMPALGSDVGGGVLQVASAVGDSSRGFWYIPPGGALSNATPSTGGYSPGGTAPGHRLTYYFDSSSGSDSGLHALGANGTVAAQTNFRSIITFLGPQAPPPPGGQAGAKLNLKDNDLIVDNATLADIKAQIVSGYAGGAWNGPGIMSDMMSGANADKALGYAAGNDPAVAYMGGTFGGQTFTPATAVLVKYTYGGDANLDGKVDVVDLGILATNWQGTGKNWTTADFNYSPDGKVDVVDLGILATNWQKGVGAPLGLSFAEALASFPEFSGVTVVPEPGTLGLLALGALGLMTRRRRS